MIYGSICSGIEAATMAWHPLGWQPVFFSEIEKFPSAVLAHHYGSNMPDEEFSSNGVPNYGDMTKFKEWPDHGRGSGNAIDVLVGGTPCQSFSVAGLREGLADPRGNLMLTFGAIAQQYKPRWILWENVPGVLSCNKGRDFGAFLRLLGECGYGFAYRVLDAQYVRVDGFERAVPQRRRRVFVVGYFGDWRPAAAVLSEPEGMFGHTAPRRKAEERPSGFTQSSFGQYREGCGTLTAQGGDLGGGSEVLVPFETQAQAVAVAQNSRDEVRLFGGDGQISGALTAQAGTKQQTYLATHDDAGTMLSRNSSGGFSSSANHAAAGYMAMSESLKVRRLVPVECERLQGFPDNFTQIPWRNKPFDQCPDGPRYKALGNSMAVNVMRWIGVRIEMTEALIGELT